ncbi:MULTISPECIES: hypothetical protein [Ramlibacter]|uniref:Uncharacterized protein n=1 Tax=Ramlibacter pinisoli TaxID=2682844 RepID=A0A6N8IXJ6_9BURK|nr:MULTISPECIES: hypothetical protein [Ramlibacter]MBA2961555.1 hypothetical protein [Ramlibacter sp. CGMCC 1.13660]MVQ31498.1 hypothetical protein [Ramlibacter pinisoli]
MPPRRPRNPEAARPGRQLMAIAWPSFLAACLLQAAVFAVVDPLELQWFGQQLGWSRQAVHAAAFFLFWAAAMLSSAVTALLELSKAELDG